MTLEDTSCANCFSDVARMENTVLYMYLCIIYICKFLYLILSQKNLCTGACCIIKLLNLEFTAIWLRLRELLFSTCTSDKEILVKTNVN